MKIIAFTGMPLSGKTEAVQLAKERGIPAIRMGDVVWDEVRNQGLELDDKAVGAIADQMRKKHGEDIWARRTVDKIKLLHKPECVVIDGIRNVEEIEVFKKELSNDFTLIAIAASPAIRQQRALQRGRSDDSKTLEAIQERDRRELRWGLDAVLASADVVVSNEGSIAAFRETIEKIFQEFLKR